MSHHTSKLSSWDERFCDVASTCYLHSTHWTCVIIMSFGCCKPTVATTSSRCGYQIWKWTHLHFALVLWVMHTALLISSPLSQLFLFSKLLTRCQCWSLLRWPRNDVARVCSVIIPNATSMQRLHCRFKSWLDQAKVFLWINHFHTTLMTWMPLSSRYLGPHIPQRSGMFDYGFSNSCCRTQWRSCLGTLPSCFHSSCSLLTGCSGGLGRNGKARHEQQCIDIG